MEVVINRCFGGFGLSYEAVMEYAKLSGFKLYAFSDARDEKGNLDLKHYVPYDGNGEQPFCLYYTKKPLTPKGHYSEKAWFSPNDIPRNDAILIKVIRKLKTKANDKCANLDIIEIPDGIDWEIEEYDGLEHIAEKHRTWY